MEVNEIRSLLSNDKLLEISKKFKEHISEHQSIGFNIFNLISEKYYHENLHSDVIAAFLNPNGEHDERNKFLLIFLELLQKIKPDLSINLHDFTDATITREENRIDILIRDKISKKVIIIENKINNAGDTYRQLPKYVGGVRKENVVAIVYLPLNPNKEPSKNKWTEDEEIFIKEKLILLPAYNRTEYDFFNGWLKLCISNATQNSTEILKQYAKLIQKIGGYIMNAQLHADLYNLLKENDNYTTTMNLGNLVDEIPNYLAVRIQQKFADDFTPFDKPVAIHGAAASFEWFKLDDFKLKISISCKKDQVGFFYRFRFWDENYRNKHLENVLMVIGKLKLDRKDEFKKNPDDNDEMSIDFRFPNQEDLLYEFIKNFKTELATLIKV